MKRKDNTVQAEASVMDYNIRLATSDDSQAIFGLMKKHAEFEGLSLAVSEQEIRLQNLNDWPVSIYVVEAKGELQGYMSLLKQFSTWDMQWYLYLDCLYLNQAARSMGIGQQLMQRLKVHAKEHGISQVQWQTPDDNAAAIGFYRSLGAFNKKKQRFFWDI